MGVTDHEGGPNSGYLNKFFGHRQADPECLHPIVVGVARGVSIGGIRCQPTAFASFLKHLFIPCIKNTSVYHYLQIQ